MAVPAQGPLPENIEGDLNDDGKDDLDESGMGDTDIRFLTVPYLDMKKKRAIALGMEVFFDTASEDALGSGATSLGPQVFAVFFKPFGGMFDLFAPAYQHKFSIDEDDGRSDVHQGLIDENVGRQTALVAARSASCHRL